MNIVICDDERKVIEDVGSICRIDMQRMFISGCQIIWIPVGGEFIEKS